jgi:hypothetical protein
MTGFADKVDEVHRALSDAEIPHALGGALALAYCIHEARATGDIDVNIFVAPDHADAVFAALPSGVQVTTDDRQKAPRDGQVRLWWDDTPVDLFFGYHPFHEYVAGRVHLVPFGDKPMPVIDCTDLAVFKTMYNRSRDWADLEAMVSAGTVNAEEALVWIGDLLGVDSDEYRRLAALFGRRPVEVDEAVILRRAFGRPGGNETP